MLTGVLLIDKAKGPTSHDVVQAVRAITGVRRCGHTGTLDPFATGLLPVCLGRATRLARFISGEVKAYRAVVRFGFATDTYDVTGRSVGSPADVALERDVLERVLAKFVGKLEQVPPPFSAKRIGGQRMYRLARAGVPVEPKPVEVVIRRIELIDLHGADLTLDVEVESGTYIRSLAHDLGKAMGSGAHLAELRRTRVGPLRLDQAIDLDRLHCLQASGSMGEALLTPSEALAQFPAVRLGEEAARKLRHGNKVSLVDLAGEPPELVPTRPVRVLDSGGELVAVAKCTAESKFIRPVVVIQDAGKVQPDKSLQTADASDRAALQPRNRVV